MQHEEEMEFKEGEEEAQGIAEQERELPTESFYNSSNVDMDWVSGQLVSEWI